MKRHFIPATLLFASLTSCQKQISSETLMKSITQSPYAVQDICSEVKLHMDVFQDNPVIAFPENTDSPDFKRYLTLQDFGYVTIWSAKKTKDPTQSIEAASPDELITTWQVKVNDKWFEDFEHLYDGKRCYGKWRAKNIKTIVKADQTTAEAEVTGDRQYTRWATRKPIRELLGIPEPSEETKIFQFRKENDTWQVTSSQDIPTSSPVQESPAELNPAQNVTSPQSDQNPVTQENTVTEENKATEETTVPSTAEETTPSGDSSTTSSPTIPPNSTP